MFAYLTASNPIKKALSALSLSLALFTTTLVSAQVEKIGSGFRDMRYLGRAGNNVIFASDKGKIYQGIYKTDGTKKGTKLIKSFFQGTRGYIGGDDSLHPSLGNLLLFIAHKGNGKWGIWSTDGSTKGTKEVLANVGDFSFSPINYLEYNKKLYFFFKKGKNYGLWETDGTKKGTKLLKDMPSYFPKESEDVYDPLYKGYFTLTANGFVFLYSTPEQRHEVWVSDGSAEGTRKLTEFSELSGIATNPNIQILSGYAGGTIFKTGNGLAMFPVEATSLSSGEKVYFTYLTDGTTQGTSAISTADGSMFVNAVQFLSDDKKSTAYVLANKSLSENSSLYCKLYELDLTTRQLRELKIENNTSPFPEDLQCQLQLKAVVNSVLFFVKGLNEPQQFFRTEGTIESTQLLGTFGTYAGPRLVQTMAGRLFFKATDQNNVVGLWQSDGTPAGTAPVGGGLTLVNQAIAPVSLNGKAFLVAGIRGKGQDPYTFVPTASEIQKLIN